MYNNDDIQKMITKCKNDAALREKVLDGVSSHDKFSVADVISDGWYERFDRYDSDVCEQFITAYEKATENNQTSTLSDIEDEEETYSRGR